MTRYDEQTRKQMKQTIVGQKIIDMEYDEEGDYYTFVLEDNNETSFRFMADLE